MELTKAEKLMLEMLADIHRATVPKGQGHIDPDFVSEAITFNPWALKWEYFGLLSDEESVSDETANQVAQHLTMWSVIEADFERLKPEDQEAVKTAVGFGEKPTLTGYDGNNETDHFSAAKMMVGPLGRFAEFASRDLNSHAPSVDRYDRMHAVYETIVRAAGLRVRSLTADQIIEILSA